MADPTLGDLHKLKAVTPKDVAAAVDTYTTDPSIGKHRIGSYVPNLAAAVRATAWPVKRLLSRHW